MGELGRFFVIVGIIMVCVGIFIMLVPKINLFRLPGDIYYKKNNFTLYIPLTTSILISLIITLILNLLKKS